MYQIKHNSSENSIEITNSKKTVYGVIQLNQGASLQELTLNRHAIIKKLDPLAYHNTYASSILFPFANRIKDGAYAFEGTSYQFRINQKEENNALHGLVFDKTFKVADQKADATSATLVLEYRENTYSEGFPYTYNIQLTYIFTEDKLSLSIAVKNTDSKPFPFTIGWHPYFASENLHDSSLNFTSDEKLNIGARNITVSVKPITPVKTFHIKDQKLDDCWILKGRDIQFNTPQYQFTIDSSEDQNFLQLFTPPKANIIAIEPTTGVSDSFNNKIGLQTLDAKAVYNITWNLKLKPTNDN